MELLIGFLVIAIMSSVISVGREGKKTKTSYERTVVDTSFNRDSAKKV